MRICPFDNRVGIVDGQDVIDVSAVVEQIPPARWPFPRGGMFIAMLPTLRPEMEKLARTGERVPLSAVQLQSPVVQPGKLIAAPVNHRLHLDESRRMPASISAATSRRSRSAACSSRRTARSSVPGRQSCPTARIGAQATRSSLRS